VGCGTFILIMINNLEVELRVELGSTQKNVKDILTIGQGTIIELDKNANDPATIYVNNVKFGEGEVVSVDEYFGIRITKIFN
jgi:flagellar motor switch protein FliN/FliY